MRDGPAAAQLRALLVLQECDLRLAEARRTAGHLPEELMALQKRLAAREAEAETVISDSRRIEVARKKLELDAGSARDRIAKYRTQMNSTRSNEQYSALMHEIEAAEKEIVRIEDEELELMEQYEAARAIAQREEAALAEFRKTMAAQESAARQRAQTAQQRIGGLEPEREAKRAVVDASVLSRYERLVAGKGSAVVPLVHGNTCGGCHMQVTHQTTIDVRKGDHLAACDNCGRFLYPEEMELG